MPEERNWPKREYPPDPLQPKREALLKSEDRFMRALGHMADGRGLEFGLITEEISNYDFDVWAKTHAEDLTRAALLRKAKYDFALYSMVFPNPTKKAVSAAHFMRMAVTPNERKSWTERGRPAKDKVTPAEEEAPPDVSGLSEGELRRIAGYDDSPDGDTEAAG